MGERERLGARLPYHLARPSEALPDQEEDQAQEHGAQRGIDAAARAQRAASPALASTVVRHGGRGEGRLGIEERGAGAIIRRQCVEVGDVLIHEGRYGLPCLVGMLQTEYMPQFVEHDPM